MRLSSGKIILLCFTAYASFCSFLFLSHKKKFLFKFLTGSALVVIIVGLFILSYVLKGVYDFNNSDESYQQLKKEMDQVKSKLGSMGFSFDQFNINLSQDENKTK